MTTREERLRWYRDRAEELRAAGENMKTPESRASFARMARDYEILAESLEGLIK